MSLVLCFPTPSWRSNVYVMLNPKTSKYPI
jgi:hypothetical protein